MVKGICILNFVIIERFLDMEKSGELKWDRQTDRQNLFIVVLGLWEANYLKQILGRLAKITDKMYHMA